MWWVIFNNPGACAGSGCGAADLANPVVRASVFYAAGFVTGDDGTGNISAEVDAGALPVGLDVEPDGTVAGLDGGNGLAAEVHLVIRAHGPVIPGMADAQFGFFDGGCPRTPVPMSKPPILRRWPGTTTKNTNREGPVDAGPCPSRAGHRRPP